MVQKASEEVKACLADLDQDRNGLPGQLKGLAEAMRKAGEVAKAKVEEATRLLRERFGREV